MAVTPYNPTTPGRRGMTSQDFSEITKKKPEKSLTKKINSSHGRNNQGRITSRRRQGGAKKLYRIMTSNLPDGTNAEVIAIEYDPFRSSRIALIKTTDDVKHYIIAYRGAKPGDKISYGPEATYKPGSRMPLVNMPIGAEVYDIEFTPGRGGQMVKTAGGSAQLTARDAGYALLRLPSGEIRRVKEGCYASVGSVGNEQHQNIKIGKAGRNRHKGKRPSVRGVVMNAADHPHGGGDGGRHGPGKAPRTPWGQHTLGYRTRRNKRSNKMIVRTKHESKR